MTAEPEHVHDWQPAGDWGPLGADHVTIRIDGAEVDAAEHQEPSTHESRPMRCTGCDETAIEIRDPEAGDNDE